MKNELAILKTGCFSFKRITLFALSLSIVSILFFSGLGVMSGAQFLESAVYFTGGRGTFHTVFTATFIIVLTLPLHGLLKKMLSDNSLCVLTRMKSRFKWFSSFCFALFSGAACLTAGYLTPIFLFAFLFFPLDITVAQYLYLYLITAALMFLFLCAALLAVNYAAMFIPLSAAVLTAAVVFGALGFVPRAVVWIDLLNPVSNLYFDVHTDRVVKAGGFVQWQTRGYPCFTPLFSVAYFVALNGLFLVSGWLYVRKMDILGCHKQEG
jgi:hypothetical protein